MNLIIIINSKESGAATETMTSKDAAIFPIMASVTLGGLYIFFKVIMFIFPDLWLQSLHAILLNLYHSS